MNDEQLKEFTELRMLLNSNEWPEAVNKELICDINSEEDKFDRANGILNLLELNDLSNLSFLDFGCGEGHIVINCNAKLAIGYDIDKINSKLTWENLENNKLLTTDFNKIKEFTPFDKILLYDVLDHVDNPIEILNQAKDLLIENGKITVRCHPFCGRHGGHLYQQTNKAFVHLIFSEEEMQKLGYDLINTQHIIYPLKTYEDYFNKVKLKIEYNFVERVNVEEFFNKNQLVKNRLMKHWNRKIDGEFPRFQMEQCFIDYVLTK